MPNSRSPRLLVPASNPGASARAMMRFSAALSVSDTVARIGVSTLLRARARSAFPDRVTVSEAGPSLRAHLADVLGEPVDLSLGLGTARVNRKPVLQVFDSRGRSVAFAKVGDNALTEPLVRAEAEALEQLGAADLPAELVVPRLLHLGQWNGMTIVVMSALDTSFRQRPRRQFDVPAELMSRFHGSFRTGTGSLDSMPLWRRIMDLQGSLTDPGLQERWARIVSGLGDLAAGAELDRGAWHGDWTPWNMSRGGGLVRVWDWERFETEVPDGLDRCHYAVNALTRRDGTDVATVLRGLELAGASPQRRDQAHLVAATYLATIGCRYLESVATVRGEAIADRADVVLTTLETWLGFSDGAAGE